MKKLFFFLFTAISFSNSFSQTIVPDAEISTVARQINVSFDASKISSSISRNATQSEISTIQNLSGTSNKYDFSKINVYEITKTDGRILTSIEVANFTNNTEILIYISDGTDYILHEISKIYAKSNDSYKITSNSITGSSNRGGLNGWKDCMLHGMNTVVGLFITGMGIAGGVGCVACGIISAFTFGVMALGCAG